MSVQDPPARSAMPTPVAIARGIHCCRRGEWHSGLHYLRLAREEPGDTTLPGLYYSYLGHALARCERKHSEAAVLCEHAVTIEFFQPETYLNLAWVRALSGHRGKALEAVERGLAMDPAHVGLRRLRSELGQRRPPVLRFLRREHPINRWLGMQRHAWLMRA